MTRRQMLQRCGVGFGTLGLAGLMASDAFGGSIKGGDALTQFSSPLAPQAPHFKAKAKHVIHLFMNGGPSHVDTFDPKPLLNQYHGKNLPRRTCRPNARPAPPSDRRSGSRSTARAASR